MKFSDFDLKSWEENHQFYDTCLLPFTGLTGTESPVETAEALGKMRDFLDIVERLFKGRIVTYPAIQYTGERNIDFINEVCQKVKSSIFQYAIVLTVDVSMLGKEINESDLVLSLTDFDADEYNRINSAVSKRIQEMWQYEP